MVKASRVVPPKKGPVCCSRCGRQRRERERLVWESECTDCQGAEAPADQLLYYRGSKAIVCMPWQGEYDANDHPIDDLGQLVLPGPRSCGHRDCINPEHVVPEKETAAA